MNEHDALRVRVAQAAGWKIEDRGAGQYRFALIYPSGKSRDFGFSRRGDGLPLDSESDAWNLAPALTLDWLRSLRQSFTEMQQDRYHSELCAVLRPGCACNIVGTWDMIQASVEHHAKAYIATMQPK